MTDAVTLLSATCCTLSTPSKTEPSTGVTQRRMFHFVGSSTPDVTSRKDNESRDANPGLEDVHV